MIEDLKGRWPPILYIYGRLKKNRQNNENIAKEIAQRNKLFMDLE